MTVLEDRVARVGRLEISGSANFRETVPNVFIIRVIDEEETHQAEVTLSRADLTEALEIVCLL